jgi:hypothetical protein
LTIGDVKEAIILLFFECLSVLIAVIQEVSTRALSFFALLIAIVALILVNRSASESLPTAFRRPNRALVIGLPLVALMLAATLLIPFVSNLFRFGPLHSDDLLITPGAGVVVLVVLELSKALWRAAFGRRLDATTVTTGALAPVHGAEQAP